MSGVKNTAQLEFGFRIAGSYMQVYMDELRSGVLRELTTSELMVWLALRANARLKDGRIRLSLTGIQEWTGLQRATVQKAVTGLVEKQALERAERRGPRGSVHYYALHHFMIWDRAKKHCVGVVALRYAPKAIQAMIRMVNAHLAKGEEDAVKFNAVDVGAHMVATASRALAGNDMFHSISVANAPTAVNRVGEARRMAEMFAAKREAYQHRLPLEPAIAG